MSLLNVTIKSDKRAKKITIEMDADKFEKLAAQFGFFNPVFLNSIRRAEEDYKSGRVRKIESLKDLR